MFADTTTIRALARRLRERADEIRDLAAGLSSSARDVDWQGVAADAMRDHVHGRVLALHRAAGRHDDAADALDRHAGAVDAVVGALEDAAHHVEHVVDGPIGKLKELL